MLLYHNTKAWSKRFLPFFCLKGEFFSNERKKAYFFQIPLDKKTHPCYNSKTSRGLFLWTDPLKEGEYAPCGATNSEDIMRERITLACSECKQRNYDTMKNKKNDPDRLEMNKYCPFCRKHTKHKETK